MDPDCTAVKGAIDSGAIEKAAEIIAALDKTDLPNIGDMPCPEPVGSFAQKDAPLFFFTPREQSVALLLLQGDTKRLIAQKMGISENTVKYHVRCLYEKTGVHTRQDFKNIFERRLHRDRK